MGVADTVGSPDGIAFQGDYAYAAWGTGFAVFHVSIPTRPALVSSISTPGGSKDVAVAGSYAYVAGGSGLHVIDIADPHAPVLLGSADSYGRNPEAVVVSGSYAYLADQYGISVFDVSAPAAPKLVKGAGPGDAAGLAMAGTKIYAAAGDLQVIDFRNPLRPEFVARLETPGGAVGVALSGSRAYVADGWSGLQIVDITNPAVPAIIASVETGGYVETVVVDSGVAYVTHRYGGGLSVIGVANPLEAKVLGQAGQDARCVAVRGSHAYVGASRLEVFDVSNPVPPRIEPMGRVELCGVDDVVVSGAYAYVAELAEDEDEDCAGGLRVLDTSDSAQARLVASLEIPGGLCNLAVAGSHLYAAAPRAGVLVFDIFEPQAPRQVGNFGAEYWTCSVAVSGSFAYATNVSDGLYVFDVSSPSSPRFVRSVESLADSWALTVMDDHAFMTNDRGLVVLDLADPAVPRAVGSVAVKGSFAVAGSKVYVADSQKGFVVVDVSNPAAPVIVGSVACEAGSIVLDGSYAFVAARGRMAVLDISTPSAPQILGGSDGMRPVGVAGTFVLGMDWRGDLHFLPRQCDATTVGLSDLAAEPGIDAIRLGWADRSGSFRAFEVLRAPGADPAPEVYVRLGAAQPLGDRWEYVDATVFPGATYAYRIEGRAADGSLTLFGPVVATALPGRGLALGGVQPTPARQTATISFFLPAAGGVRLEAYDVRGRRVRLIVDEVRQPGAGTVVWDGLDDAGHPVGSGLYFLRVTAGGTSRVTRAAFVR